MKKILLYLLLLPALAMAQPDTSLTRPNGSNGLPIASKSFTFFTGNYGGVTVPYYYSDGVYRALATRKDLNVQGFTVTSTPAIGQVITTGSVQQAFQQLYQQSQPPVVTFTGGTTFELTSAGTGTASLPYTYAKQTGSNDFVSLQFTSSAGGSSTIGATPGGGSGTYSASFPSNTSTTFTFRANTTDKFATASTTVSYSAKRYWGRSAGVTPTTTEILASAGGGNALSGSKAGSFVIIASGTNYPFFAYPSSLGTLTSIKDANGLEAISSYNTGTLSLTNASGYTQTYRYYVAQNATAGNTTMTTQ
jgi:hypothetical protein